jgi:hypothetical protein
MTLPFWTPEKKSDYRKLLKAREHRRKYIRDYMRQKREEGKIKHWRQYLKEKNEAKKS